MYHVLCLVAGHPGLLWVLGGGHDRRIDTYVETLPHALRRGKPLYHQRPTMTGRLVVVSFFHEEQVVHGRAVITRANAYNV